MDFSRHWEVDENSLESPQGIAISSELEPNILGIDLGPDFRFRRGTVPTGSIVAS